MWVTCREEVAANLFGKRGGLAISLVWTGRGRGGGED